MSLFKKTYTVDYVNLISKLENGDENDIIDLLWQPKNKKVKYGSITKGLIQKLKKNDSSSENLTIHKKLENGRFELIIFEIPWTTSDVPYSPLIIDRTNSRIVGIMLPFNELHDHLGRKENKKIGDLGIEWTGFVFNYRFKK